jgi:hypothetical protein
MEVIKELIGFSGSKIYLMRNDEHLFVRKIGNVDRNFNRLQCLSSGYNVPKIYRYENDELDIEYIHGLDIVKYLESNNIDSLRGFIFDTIDIFSKNSSEKDFTSVYETKLNWITYRTDLPFTKDQLLNRLPKILPQSTYHGDFTLENVIATNSNFYMIDCVDSEYDSYIFDIAKMRQDLECKWLLRNNPVKIDIKLQNLQRDILNRYPLANNDDLLILMLLRVLNYAETNSSPYNFLIREIKRLWK